MPLRNQTVVITGASGGIGSALARHFARAGASLVLHGFRQRDRLELLSAELARAGTESIIVLADLSDKTDRSRLVDTAWSWRGTVDVWMNNAGADVLTQGADQDFAQKMERLWQVDVCGTIELSRQIGKLMVKAKRGVILNMGWDQADQGMAGESGEMFAATKGAIMAFSKSLAQSLAPYVRVNCLAPGWIQTSWGASTSEYWNSRACRESLRNRWGTPDDVAATALFLASPESEFLNGQVVAINGGYRFGDATPA